MSYHDPYIPKLQYEDFNMQSISLDTQSLQKFDCVVIATNHSDYNWEWIVRESRSVLDTRNATKNLYNNPSNVIKL